MVKMESMRHISWSVVLAVAVWSLLPLRASPSSDSNIPPGLYTRFDEEFRRPAGPWTKAPIPKPAYPTDEFVILDYNFAFTRDPGDKKGFLGAGVPYSYFELLAANGVRGIKLNYTLPARPELTRGADEEIIRHGLKVFYIDVPDEGRWLDLQERRKKDPNLVFWDFKVPARIEDLEQWKTVNYLLETFPDCRVLLLVGGELEDVQYLTYPRTEHRFELIRRAYIERHRAWLELLKKNILQPDQVLTFEQASGSAYPIAYLLKAYDMAQTKTWGRQSVQVNLANNRGASRCYDRPMMLADDPWVGDLWFTRSPEEMEQVFYLGYFSGVDYLYHEYPFLVQVGSEFEPNRWGQKYLDFARFSALHPKRGRQVVKLAVMRGFGDTWDKIYTQYTPGAWGDPKHRRVNDDTIRDYHLLNMFFPQFGTHYQTDPYRFCTGTPFGPVDLVPWDSPVEKLKAYETVFFFGLNAMDDEQYRALKEYVRQGGVLVLSLGQLRGEGKDPREILPAARRDDFLGARLDGLPELVPGPTSIRFGETKGSVEDHYRVTPVSAQIVARTEDGAPVVISNDHGKGRAYLYATDFLSQVSEDANRRFLEDLARPAKLLEMQPASDWLEYTAGQKGGILLLAFFNHGQMRSPSGNGPDHGPWKGTVTVPFEKFPALLGEKLEAFLVALTDPDFQLTPLPLIAGPGGVSFSLTVDRRAEVVVGPSGKSASEFFHGRP